VCAGKEQPLEVLESDEGEVLTEDSEEDGGETQDIPDGDTLDLCQPPKMKTFPGDSAPGLRIRNAPSFMVRFYFSALWLTFCFLERLSNWAS
jgi:hypothetical protein